jgi:tetratricopeptide (TPR) repeat protein
MRVLSVTGWESESNLAFAGLHQLLRPLMSGVAALPSRQARALMAALGQAHDPAPADPLLTGIGALTLLSDLSEHFPVLVVADDAHWLDRSSADVLAFAGSRLDAERVVLLVGARGAAPPAAFGRGFPELHLEPLSAADAGRLLDGQPRPPRGRARTQVLAQAGGNPMALIELAKVIADDPAASRRWAAEPLPLSDRLIAVLSARFAALPEQARAVLLQAAVADGPDLSVAGSHGAAPDARVLAPAEQLGLVKVDTTGMQFSHPLVRSAIYHSAPFAGRAAAQRQLAEALHDQPDRQAWHLAAAAVDPDEGVVASLLEATAALAQARGGAAAAVLALERAAELSPDRGDQARRLVAAASAAVPAGQADRVQDLAARALAVTADPELRLTARHVSGWALAYSGGRTAALPALLSVAEEASRDFARLAWDALSDAAIVVYHLGAQASGQSLSRVLGLLEDQPPAPGHGPRAEADSHSLWIRACTDPFCCRDELVRHLRQMAASRLDEPALWRVGFAAWLMDESDLAITLLRAALQQLRAPGTQGTSGPGLTSLGWLYIDTGRWDEALEAVKAVYSVWATSASETQQASWSSPTARG